MGGLDNHLETMPLLGVAISYSWFYLLKGTLMQI